MSLDVAGDFTQLAFHLLAHVPRSGPGNLFDARRVAWSGRVLGPRVQALLDEDAAVLAALWRASPALDVLDALPDLHASIAALRRVAARPLSDLDDADVACPDLLRALQRLGPAGELVHAALGLLAEPFARALEDGLLAELQRARAAIGPALTRLSTQVPGLAGARVELAAALGRRGRALPGRIVVGTLGPRGEPDPLAPAIVAAHEHLVCLSGHTDYTRAEWSALVRGARCLRAAPADLRDAHAAWLASLDLSRLVDAASALGLVAPADAAALRDAPRTRADRLAARPE